MFDGEVVGRGALLLAPAPLLLFLEHNVAADVDASRLRIVQAIGLGPGLVADKDDAPAPVI